MLKLDNLESRLKERVQQDESRYSRADRPADSLWGHLVRVASIAVGLGAAEGVEPLACRLAGLFHDAGKFSGGRYHESTRSEEEQSIDILNSMAGSLGIHQGLLDRVAEAILQLYRDDPDPTVLARVLFDADNLDKIGPLGIGNFFVKAGLRGRGMGPSLLYSATVELTYARHAPRCMTTSKGRLLATKRAAQTTAFILDLLDSLKEDQLYQFQVEQVTFDNLLLDIVSPVACDCGAGLERRLWTVPGLKCTEIHLEHSCTSCGFSHELRFCRPRLV